jgi:hypothetical protein
MQFNLVILWKNFKSVYLPYSLFLNNLSPRSGICPFIWTNLKSLHPGMLCSTFVFKLRGWNNDSFPQNEVGQGFVPQPLYPQLFVSNQGRQKQDCNLARNISTPVNLQVWNPNKKISVGPHMFYVSKLSRWKMEVDTISSLRPAESFFKYALLIVRGAQEVSKSKKKILLWRLQPLYVGVPIKKGNKIMIWDRLSCK